MKKTGYFALAILAATAFTSCGVRVYSEKDKVSKRISVRGDFNEIQTLACTDIEYTDGPASFTLYAPESQIDKIEIYVQEGTLVVTQKEGKNINGFNNNTHSKLVVSYPGVSKFTTYGTGDITIDTSDVKELTLTTCGTGDIGCEGAKCSIFTATSEGTGDIEVDRLNCVSSYIRTDGTGDIVIKDITADLVDAGTYGTGDIYLAGKCKTSKLQKEGTGDIESNKLKEVQ